MRPSDSLVLLGRGSGSPCLWPTSWVGVFSWPPPARTHRRWGVRDCSKLAPVVPATPRGTTRVSRVTGSSSCCAPDSNTPPGPSAARP